MLKAQWIFLLVFLLLLTPITVPASDFDGIKPLICALKDDFECGPDGCERVTSEAINLPQFLRLNFKEKQITTVREGVQARTTKMERAESLESSLFVQGLENNLAWSLVIDKAAGKMVMTIAGDQVGFVVFGACTTP
jgi:hypothetical protein